MQGGVAVYWLANGYATRGSDDASGGVHVSVVFVDDASVKKGVVGEGVKRGDYKKDDLSQCWLWAPLIGREGKGEIGVWKFRLNL